MAYCWAPIMWARCAVRLIFGARVSMIVGITAVLVAGGIGTLLGIVSVISAAGPTGVMRITIRGSPCRRSPSPSSSPTVAPASSTSSSSWAGYWTRYAPSSGRGVVVKQRGVRAPGHRRRRSSGPSCGATSANVINSAVVLPRSVGV